MGKLYKIAFDRAPDNSLDHSAAVAVEYKPDGRIAFVAVWTRVLWWAPWEQTGARRLRRAYR